MRNMRALLLLLLPLWLIFPAVPNSSDAMVRPPRPILIRLPDESSKPVILQSLEIKADIVGGLAKTEVQMVFYNPNSRVLEGELHFPLSGGQNIESFALEMEDGALREAVAVGKAKGREAFDSVTRQRIDPALLEKTQGNNFKLRVYPLNPQRTRRVVLRYTEILFAEGGRGLYRLPITGAEKLEDFSLAVNVMGVSSAPVAESFPLGRVEFKKGGTDRYAAHLKAKDSQIPKMGAMLKLSVPLDGRDQVTTQTFNGDHYFYAQLPTRMIGEAAKLSQPLPKIRTLTILWDASGSGQSRNMSAEMGLLNAIFKEHKNVAVRLQVARNQAEPQQKIAVKNGDWKELHRAILNERFDGASNIKAFAPDDKADVYLLFTDGLSNYASEDGTTFNFSAFKAPIFAVSSSAGSDADLLREIAEKTGGRFVDLTQQPHEAAAKTLFVKRAALSGAQSKGVRELQIPSRMVDGENFPLAGLLTEPKGSVDLTFTLPDGSKKTVTLPLVKHANPSEIAAKEWARIKAGALGSDFYRNRGRIEELGKKFALVTRNTSLIVLDRVEDYVRYEIEPPAELKAAYQRMMSDGRRLSALPSKEEHKQYLANIWQQHVNWWNTDYPKGKRPPRQEAQYAGGTVMMEDAIILRRKAAEPTANSPKPVPPPLIDGNAENVFEVGSVPEIAPPKYDLSNIRNAPKADAYRVYLLQRDIAGDDPYFYMDAADILKEKKLEGLAVRALSNLAEINLEDRRLLRLLGGKLMEYGRHQEAVMIYSKVMRIAEEEPQSYRDLALAYEAMGNSRQAALHLWYVASKPWDRRFPGIQLTALVEMNRAIQNGGLQPETLVGIPREYIKSTPLDLRVVATWDTDNVGVPLTITDPNGETAYGGVYNGATYQGGIASPFFPQGYGPEVYSLRKAKPGTYTVNIRYNGNRSQQATEFTTATVIVYRNYGTPKQSAQRFTLRLGAQDRNKAIEVTKIKVR